MPDPSQAGIHAFVQAGQALAQNLFGFLAQQQANLGQQAIPLLPAGVMPDGGRLSELQRGYVEQHARLWNEMLRRRSAEAALPEPGDRRFSAP